MNFGDLQFWDQLGSAAGGAIAVAGAVCTVVVAIIKLIPIWTRREERKRWRTHLDAISQRARVMPSEGLDAAITTEALKNTYVQLAIQPQRPDAASPAPLPAASPSSSVIGGDIWQLLRTREEKVLFVLGRPGSGKTTLIHHIAAELAGLGRWNLARSLRALWRGRPNAGPLWIRLRDFVSAQPDMLTALSKQWWDPPANHLVLVDGLDEVPDHQRRDVALWISRQAASGSARWIVTARPEGFEKLEVPCCHLEVQPLDLAQIGKLVDAQFQGEPAKAASLLQEIRNRETYYQFARNPLLLRMMVDLHRKGESAETRVELYRKILDSVLFGRLKERGHQQAVLPPDALLPVLAKVAWEMGSRLEVSEKELRGMISRHTSQGSEVEAQVQAAFHFFPGDTHRREFAHRSFQEYLAATAVPEDNPEPLFLRYHSAAGSASTHGGSFWNETVRFYAALSPGRFALVFDRCHEHRPDLLIECGLDLLETPEWSESRAKFTAWLGAMLDHPEKWRQAAEARLRVRMRSLEPRGEDEVADSTLITNAELQLFLDTEQGGELVPLHWNRKRFAPGTGAASAVGVSSKCARLFSAWVSKQDPLGVYVLPIRPSPSQLSPRSGVGFWCRSNDFSYVWPQPSSIDDGRAALRRLAEAFIHAGGVDLDRVLDRARRVDLDRDIYLNRDVDLARSIAHLGRLGARRIAIAFARQRDRDVDLARSIASALDPALDLDRALARSLTRALAVTLTLIPVRDRDLGPLDNGALCFVLAAAAQFSLDGTPRSSEGTLATWLRRFRLLLPGKAGRSRRLSLEQARDRYLDLFLQFLILDERRKGNPLFAPFEGIRLVKKRRDPSSQKQTQ